MFSMPFRQSAGPMRKFWISLLVLVFAWAACRRRARAGSIFFFRQRAEGHRGPSPCGRS